MHEAMFNGILLNDYLVVKSIKESILPPINTIRKKIPGKCGSKFIKKELGEKQIEIEVEITANSFIKRENTINFLASKLYTQEEKELKLRNSKIYHASLDSDTDLENIVFNGTTTLKFIATDPIAYGETKAFDITDNSTIYNLGTYPTTGTITIEITEEVDHIEATLQNTGEFIYLEHNFIPGDTVAIDLEEEMAYKNGYSIMEDCYLESDFFEIPVGEFEITTSTGNATLEYKERWL